MKFMKLLTAAYVGGALRHPHEGVLHVDDADAERLLEEKAAEDVTADFSTTENEGTPTTPIATEGGMAEASAPENPHQVEVAPQAADDDKPKASKPSASKE